MADGTIGAVHPDRLRLLQQGGAAPISAATVPSQSTPARDSPQSKERKHRRKSRPSRSRSRSRPRRKDRGRRRSSDRRRKNRRKSPEWTSSSDSESRSKRRRGREEKSRGSRKRRSRRRSPSSSSSPSSSPRRKKSKKKKKKKHKDRSNGSGVPKQSGFSSVPPTTGFSSIGGGFSGAPVGAQIGTVPSQDQKAKIMKMVLERQQEASNRQLTRAGRRIYVGNLPSGLPMNNEMLTQYFSTACKQLGLTAKEDPVLDVYITPPHKFCFIEFRSVALALEALQLLQGVTLAQTTLKIAKPRDYQLPPPHLMEFFCTGPANPVSQQQASQLIAAQVAQAAAKLAAVKKAITAAAAVSDGNAAGVTTSNADNAGPPTSVLVLLNMVTPHELVEDDEFEEIRMEIGNECNKFGHLVDVKIPRPGDVPDEDDDEDEDKPVPGLGAVFLQYNSKEDAAKARAVLHGRRFSDNLVTARYYAEDKFLKGDYGGV